MGTSFLGEGRKSILLLKASEAKTARPSVKDRMTVKSYGGKQYKLVTETAEF
jgi:hypothetical protein